jgi:hypothetical protein
MFRVVPAIFVSKRNDEIAIARTPALTKAGRDFGFDTINDLRVERDVIAGKIDILLDCLRGMRSKKKREQGEEPAKRGFHGEISAKKQKTAQGETKESWVDHYKQRETFL